LAGASKSSGGNFAIAGWNPTAKFTYSECAERPVPGGWNPFVAVKFQQLHPVIAGVLTSACASAAALLLPPTLASLGVAAVFLGATYLLSQDLTAEQLEGRGLALGGWFGPGPLPLGRSARDTLGSLGVALLVLGVVAPLFWLGFALWHSPEASFSFERALWLDRDGGTLALADLALGHLIAVALPEEVFFRGYLQSALDERWPPRWRVLGAHIGPSLVVTSAVFALGHLATMHHLTRLAVFFPSLLFGWLRARTGGVGAPIWVHAASNLLVVLLTSGYSLG